MRARSVIALLAVFLTTVACSAAEVPESDDARPAEAFEVLIVGGDEHHDFEQWFNEASTATLEEVGANVTYTDEMDEVLPALEEIDVLYLSNNQPMPGEDLRSGIFNFVNSGKGLMITHAAGWYSWDDWPEFNQVLVGGGTRHHPPYGEFEVQVEDGEHPVMEGVPETFSVEDELYHVERDPDGTPIHVLASAEDPETGDVYPVVWIVEHYSGRIVVNTLGHDGGAHEHPAFQQMLQNSALWAARQDVR